MKIDATERGGFRVAGLAVAGIVLTLAMPTAGQNLQLAFDTPGNLLSQTQEIPGPPQILAQPQRQVVMPGETASFSVIAADTRGLSYQWQSNGTTLAGATSGALLLTNVSSANEAQYDVVLANGSGSITSAPAALMIDSRGVGMPDSWQLAYFGNLNQNPTGDFDGDGVNNLQEFLDGTNPTNAASALYRITLFSDGGTVVAVPSQSSYTNGQVVTLAATGSAEAPFHAWTGDVVTRSNAITVTMNTNLTLFAHFQPLTMNWTNTVSGDWSVPSNWFPNLVPGSNESVVIVNQALTVTLNGNADLRDLSLGGNSFSEPELKVAGRLTIAGLGTWEGGTMSGPGATVVLPGASFTIISVTTPTLNGRTLENAGTMSWLGGNLIMIDGVITNDAGAQFGVGGPGTFSSGGGTPRFDNAGTLVTAAAGTTALGVAFNNYGAVTIQGGTFSLSGGGVQAGNMPVPAGTTLNFAGGTFASSNSLSIIGAGTLIVSGGTSTLGGTVNVTGSNIFSNGSVDFTGNYTCVGDTVLDISGGTVSFDGTGVVAPNTVNLYGALGGANTVTVGSVMNWTGGSMSGSGRTIIRPGATLNIAAFTGYGGVYLYDRTVENAGTVIWGGGNLGLSGVITNDAGASFQILNAAMFNYQGNTPRFDNAGTFLPSATGTTAFNGIIFDNYGAINLTGGSGLYLGGGGTNSGPVTVPAGATINFGGGVFNAGAGSSITGVGSLQVSGGTANLAGTVNVSGTNSFSNGTANLTGNYTCVGNTLLDISGGTVNFNGSGTVAPNRANLYGALGGANTVTVGSVMNWTGGSMNGSGRTIIQPGATLNIAAFTGNGGVYLYDRTLENAGTAVWGGGNLGLTGVITNDAGASFQILNAAVFNFQGNTPRFDNAGTFLPSATGTTAFNGIIFDNYGAINLTGGSGLYLRGGGTNSGPITVPAGATINFGVGVFNAGAGSSITGAGSLQVSAGTANLGGTVNVSGTNSFSNGTANLTGNYTCVGNTLLDISGGTVNFNGSGTVSPNRVNLNGALGGANTVTVGSVMNWTGGSMNGNGQTIIQPGATLNIAAFTGYGGVYLYDRTLENAGTVIWGGGNLGLSGVITNDAGASFQLLNAAMFNFQGNTPRFDNAGTFTTAGSGGTTFNPGVPLNNFNTIRIPGGILHASGGYVCSSNSILNCALWGTVPGAAFGQLQASGTVNVKGSLNVYLTNYYVPKTNDSFTVLTAASVSGAFAGFTYASNSVSMTLSNAPASEIVRVTGVSLKQTNAVPAPPGMISWWRGENNATDAVGTNNGAITNGVAYAVGEVGQSFLFDGSSGCVYIPDSTSLRPASITLEAWVRILSTNGIQLVFAKPLGTNTLDSYGLAIENGVPLAAICDNNGFGVFVSDTSVLTLGQWHHMAFTFEATTGLEALYTDGAMVASANAGKSMSFDNHPLLLGADIENTVPSYFLGGQIDEASIYNRALSASEIASIYNVGAGGKQAVSAIQQPILHIGAITPTAALCYWSTNFPGFHLEYNASLSASNWAASLKTPVITGPNFVVTNSLLAAQKYYRLSSIPAPFTPPPPSLTIQRASPGAVCLQWPADDDRPFNLQSNTNLAAGIWVSASPSPAVVGLNNRVTNTLTGPQVYYRLASP